MNLLENLGITVEQITIKETIISVKITAKLLQPHGIVHGGINAVLAETAASLAANKLAAANQIAVGVDLNTHHLRALSSGKIVAHAHPLHLGRHLQTWEVKTFAAGTQDPTSISTVTTCLQPRPPKSL
ncbi:MAG: PaaI family thioesterase [Liquorilactobacillus ghanensis]|uniref:PaaI family thioesterase n=1 Tax=Liquorilactobacillus ghanensis TaxID=399370 RepID=UPI0039ED5E03